MVVRSMRKAQDVRIETQRATTARSMRSPNYDFVGNTLPMGVLIPVSFAPVLAGDTVKSSKLMARIIGDSTYGSSDSVNAVRGHWFETWTFYVRVGDMANQDTVRELLLDPEAAGSVDFRDECMEAIWRSYFTDDPVGDATTPTPAYVPFGAGKLTNVSNRLSLPGNGWWDSITKNADLPSVTSAGGDDWQEQWIRYQALRRARLTTTTWEEYLAKNGVNVGPQLRQGELDPTMRVPELLKWQREYAYPQPAGWDNSGAEAFRVQWFIQSQVDRGRFCAEPGFIVNCMAVRPKVYRVYDRDEFDPLTLLEDASGWLPNDFDTDPHASLVSIPASVVGDTVGGAEATVDIRDLYLYGDVMAVANDGSQVSPSAANGYIELTTADRYPTGVGVFAADVHITHRIASRIGVDTTAG